MKLDSKMVPVPYDLLLMLQRRGAISFDKGDKTATYVRQLGKLSVMHIVLGHWKVLISVEQIKLFGGLSYISLIQSAY